MKKYEKRFSIAPTHTSDLLPSFWALIHEGCRALSTCERHTAGKASGRRGNGRAEPFSLLFFRNPFPKDPLGQIVQALSPVVTGGKGSGSGNHHTCGKHRFGKACLEQIVASFRHGPGVRSGSRICSRPGDRRGTHPGWRGCGTFLRWR